LAIVTKIVQTIISVFLLGLLPLDVAILCGFGQQEVPLTSMIIEKVLCTFSQCVVGLSAPEEIYFCCQQVDD
jgi:hypothetical protein